MIVGVVVVVTGRATTVIVVIVIIILDRYRPTRECTANVWLRIPKEKFTKKNGSVWMRMVQTMEHRVTRPICTKDTGTMGTFRRHIKVITF